MFGGDCNEISTTRGNRSHCISEVGGPIEVRHPGDRSTSKPARGGAESNRDVVHISTGTGLYCAAEVTAAVPNSGNVAATVDVERYCFRNTDTSGPADVSAGDIGEIGSDLIVRTIVRNESGALDVLLLYVSSGNGIELCSLRFKICVDRIGYPESRRINRYRRTIVLDDMESFVARPGKD